MDYSHPNSFLFLVPSKALVKFEWDELSLKIDIFQSFIFVIYKNTT